MNERLDSRRPSGRRLTAALVLALAGGASGCGWLFVEGPPIGYQNMDYFPCTESKGLAHLDIAMAGLQALNILYTASLEDYEVYDNFGTESRGGIIAVQAGFGALWALSGTSGYRKVNQCRAARLEAASRDLPAPEPPAGALESWRPPMLFPLPALDAGALPDIGAPLDAPEPGAPEKGAR